MTPDSNGGDVPSTPKMWVRIQSWGWREGRLYDPAPETLVFLIGAFIGAVAEMVMWLVFG